MGGASPGTSSQPSGGLLGSLSSMQPQQIVNQMQNSPVGPFGALPFMLLSGLFNQYHPGLGAPQQQAPMAAATPTPAVPAAPIAPTAPTAGQATLGAPAAPAAQASPILGAQAAASAQSQPANPIAGLMSILGQRF